MRLCETPQGLTSVGSVILASIGMSETRLVWTSLASSACDAPEYKAPPATVVASANADRAGKKVLCTDMSFPPDQGSSATTPLGQPACRLSLIPDRDEEAASVLYPQDP